MSSDNNIPHERRDTTNLSLFRLHPLCNATPDASSAFLSTYLLSHPTLLPLLGCYTAPHINNLIFQECAKGTPPPDNRHFWLQRSTTFNTTTPCHCRDRWTDRQMDWWSVMDSFNRCCSCYLVAHIIHPSSSSSNVREILFAKTQRANRANIRKARSKEHHQHEHHHHHHRKPRRRAPTCDVCGGVEQETERNLEISLKMVVDRI